MNKDQYNKLIMDLVQDIQNFPTPHHLFFVTTTFVGIGGGTRWRQIDSIFASYDALYKTICSHITPNYNRGSKRHQLPRTYDFVDLSKENPDSTPHIHSIYRLPVSNTTPSFPEVIYSVNDQLAYLRRNTAGTSSFDATLRRIETLDVQPINPGQLENTLRYASKSLLNPATNSLSMTDMRWGITKSRPRNINFLHKHHPLTVYP